MELKKAEAVSLITLCNTFMGFTNRFILTAGKLNARTCLPPLIFIFTYLVLLHWRVFNRISVISLISVPMQGSRSFMVYTISMPTAYVKFLQHNVSCLPFIELGCREFQMNRQKHRQQAWKNFYSMSNSIISMKVCA